MPQLNEKDLKKHLKSDVIYPIYLFCGDEGYLKKHYSDLLVEKCVPSDFSDLNFRRYEAKNLDLSSVFEEAEIMPMMAEKRVLLIEDYKVEAMGEKDLELLKAYCLNPPETAVIIFLQKNEDFSLSKAKKAASLIEERGAVCLLNKRTGADLLKPLMASASKHNCILTQDMARYLVSVVGDDFNTLINELSKVCNFCGEGEITKKHIDAVAIKTDDAKIYYLTKALTAKDFDKAFEVLHSLLRQKVEPEYIFGSIVSSYVDMYRAKVALASGERAEALSEAFNYRNLSFRLTNGGRDASKLTPGILRNCLEELSRADMKLKNSREQPVIILEQLMVKLFLITNGEKV